MSYPNQKKIIIKKERCDNIGNSYAKINIKAMQKAMQELNSMGELKLWLYFAKNQNGYIFDLSCADCGEYGLTIDTYHTAVKKLISKGYLSLEKGNTYIFNEKGLPTE